MERRWDEKPQDTSKVAIFRYRRQRLVLFPYPRSWLERTDPRARYVTLILTPVHSLSLQIRVPKLSPSQATIPHPWG